ncbi:MAG: hypothetical protein R2850_06080 [Bacteroidia bacterium]
MFKFKIQGFILLLCLTLPVLTQLGSYLLLKHKFEKNAKLNLATTIEKEKLVLLKFSENEVERVLSWKEKNEFEYNGEMYDVMQRFYLGNQVCFYCWPDKSETTLNKKLQALLKLMLGEHPLGKRGLQIAYDFFSNLFFTFSDEYQIKPSGIIKSLIISKSLEEITRSVAPPYLPPEYSISNQGIQF